MIEGLLNAVGINPDTHVEKRYIYAILIYKMLASVRVCVCLSVCHATFSAVLSLFWEFEVSK